MYKMIRSRVMRIRRRRYGRKRVMRRRVPRVATARTRLGHQFTRVWYRENAIQLNPSSGTLLGSNTFQLSDLPSYTEFTNLYDLYKINKVQVTFIPKINSATLNGNAQMPTVHSVIDSNDATIPASLQQLMEDESVKTTRGTQLHVRYFTPKVQQKVYESIATDGYATPRRNPFINTADPTVPHYALKWAVTAPISGGDAYWYCDVKVKFYISCREVQ